MTWALSTDEVREAYILAADTTNADRDNGEDFDHWLNRVRAEARAEALRETAEDIEFRAQYEWDRGEEFNEGVSYGANQLFDQLRERADRIEQNSEGNET